MILTLIVPSYNVDTNDLKKCIKSLKEIAIKSKEIEILFIDDKDPKESFKLAEKAFDGLDNVKIIKNEINRGVLKSTLLAAAKAKGRYSHRVDADDSVNSEALLEYIEWLRTQDVALILNKWMLNNKIKKSHPIHNKLAKHSIIFTPTITYKTSVLRKVKYPKIIRTYLEDKWLVLISMKIQNTSRYSKITWYNYSGATTSTIKEILNDFEYYEKSTKEIFEIESTNSLILNQQKRLAIFLTLARRYKDPELRIKESIRITKSLVRNNIKLTKHLKRPISRFNIIFMKGFGPLPKLIDLFIKR